MRDLLLILRAALLPPIGLAATLLAGCSELVEEPYDYGTVEVVAHRRSGEGVPGVGLVLYTGTRQLDFGATDSQGRARFDYVPFGNLGVFATPPDGYRPLSFATGYVSTFPMDEGERQEVSFTYLKFGPGSVAARVTDTDGTPLEGIPLHLYSPSEVVQEGETDASGELRFVDVPFGHYGVRAELRRGFTVPRVFRDGLIVEDGVEERAEFILQRCVGQIRVRATVEPGGAPLAGVGATLYEFTGPVEGDFTDASGEYVFDELPCTNYGVRTDPILGYERVNPPSGIIDRLVLTTNGQERLAHFTFRACRGSIVVRVVDQAGAPVANAQLIFYTWQGILQVVSTGADGGHTFADIPCGEDYAVMVRPPEGYTVVEGKGSSYFDGLTVKAGDAYQFTFSLAAS